MYTRIIAFISIVFLLQSCNSGFSVKGKINNMPSQQFIIEELGVEQNVIIDSGSTSKEGTFSITGQNKEESLYRIKFEQGKYILLALNNDDKATIDADWNQMENYTVQGSTSSIVLKGFLINLRENIKDIQTMQVILDSINAKPQNDSLKTAALNDLKNINTQFVGYVKKFADTTNSVASALFAVNIINPSYEKPYIIDFYKKITTRFPNSKNAKFFADKFLGSTSDIEPANTEKGTPAPDFSGKTIDGKSISLESYKGKYVLIDFWASWCEPCRNESANTVKIYHDFKDKNLTVIGISLDSNKDKWQEAITKDNLTWIHISELNGWANTIARNYNVTEIPKYFLIDPQGNIIANENNTANIATKLKEILL